VIGSSAGGIEALSRVVASLPADFPAPIVIAQHLDPRRPSHLHEILARRATLPVRVVEEREALEDGVIFVVPSNRMVEISHGDLRLRAAKPGAVAPSIDVLFESAARVFGPGLIAVILTGSGSDGSVGAWHVKKAGGSVVIENPATAMFPSMPSSIPPSLVDATADLESIGSVVCDLLAAGNPPAEGRDHDDLRDLLGRIHELSGIDFGSYKPATILRRLRGRMNATGRATLAEYAAYLEDNPEEYARLINSLLIKVTEFFRDPKVFDYLRLNVLPELIAEAKREGRELRIWSAGCSTGEEAYSLAIVVADALGDDLPRLDVRIFATDIDRQAIAFARRGIYPPIALKGLPAGARDRHFVKTADGYEVEKRLRALMVFGEHDLAERAPFPRIDLLLCRNVLIYFAVPMQRVALETFAFSLRPGGRLVLGMSESVMALPEPFEEELPRQRVFRRLPGSYAIPPMKPAVLRPRRTHESQLSQAIQATHREVRRVAESSESADALLLGLTVGVVVVDPRYYILRINSAARQMLGIHGTAYGQDFVHLAEVLPPSAIRVAIDAALAGRTTSALFEVESADAASETARFLEATIRSYRVEKRAVDGAVVKLAFGTPDAPGPLASPIALQAVFFLSVIFAGAFAAEASFIFGLPVLSLGSDYFGIATLGFAIIVKTLMVNSDTILPFKEMKGGRGMLGIPKLTTWAWAFIFLVLVIIIIRNFVRSSTGRATLAVREDEIAAKAMGIDVASNKLLAFVVGSFVAGIGGGIYAHYIGFLSPATFDFVAGFNPLIIVVFGGLEVTGLGERRILTGSEQNRVRPVYTHKA